MAYGFGQNGDDVFQTQADQRFNSFSSPLNPVNSNPGAWGLDPNYLTPSYASPYRPKYQGPQGNFDGGYKPGYFRSMNHILNPLEGGGVNYGGNTYSQNRSYYDSIGMRPIDASASAMQNIAIPLALSAGAFKHLSRPGEMLGGRFGAGLMGGLSGGFSPATAGKMAGYGRVAGGFAGSVALPMMAIQAGVSALDGAIFDPYTAQRGTADAMRRNTLGISYGGAESNLVNGGGMSRRAAAFSAGEISRMAAKDPTFSQMEVSQLTDFAGRSGLMDNTSGSGMASRMKEITRQVKTVMAVANTSDFKEAIEIMSKLQTSGVGSQRLSGTMGAIGGLASAAGMSTQRLMNTVGAQGQYLFGANGLTPYVGQMTAGQAAASFGTAYRSGLLSPALMARMGGVEGASQSANSGLLAGLQNTYNMVSGINAFNGGASNSVVGNMTKFGGSITGNPLAGIGNMNLLAPALTSNMAQNQGFNRINSQLKQMGGIIPGAMGANGKMEAGTAYMLMTNMMGMQPDQARAMINKMFGDQDPTTRRMQNAGFDRAKEDFFLKFADQNSMNKGIFTRPYNAVANLGRSIQKGGADIVSGITTAVGSTVDSFEQSMYEAMYGKNNSNASVSGYDFDSRGTSQIDTTGAKKYLAKRGNSDIFGEDTGKVGSMLFGGGSSIMMKSVEAINKIAGTNPEVSAMIRTRDKRSLLAKIKGLAEGGALPAVYKDKAQRGMLADIITNSGTSLLKTDRNAARDSIHGGIAKAAGLTNKSTMQGAEVLSLVNEIRSGGGKNTTQLVERLEKLTGKDLRDPDDLDAFVNEVEKNTAITGTYNAGEVFKSIGMNSDEFSKQVKERGIGAVGESLGVKGARSEEELLAKLASKKGLNIRNRGLDASKATAVPDADFARYNDAMRGIDSERSKLETSARNGVINFDTYQQATSALDNQKSVLKFESAVDQFGIYVEAVTSGKSVDTVIKNKNAGAVNVNKAGL